MSTPENSPHIDSLFETPVRAYHARISFADLPYVTRPIIEHIHDTRPDVVIAADRGGRLIGVSALKSWKQRFPGEPFPTLDRKIHFARVSSRSAAADDVYRAVHFTLTNAGLMRPPARNVELDGSSPKVMLIDDWACVGETVNRFVNAVMDFGISRSAISYGTMCGVPVGQGLEHIIGDPSRVPRDSEWNNKSFYAGVDFGWDGINPTATRDKKAIYARRVVSEHTDRYYSKFSATLAAGQIAACGCDIEVPRTLSNA